ncbi:Dehydrogenase (flavoprotein) [Modicisalibacter ilicicola DSM 19980]|uniref:Dehydrogenase (Flavoprotein) n=1 Tax=Modicisalibacter ilicicola DSM 19980 TaxID=1121942 RepID=A0A1M4ZV93_9GAMM|nr:NAD(P)/FAD-dependent oxidoreductase [Halomonas ilicicola]SHF21516.1 Dehydrogenase (flavoprotein) [Halomonas ilicicola DSM 19980]
MAPERSSHFDTDVVVIGAGPAGAAAAAQLVRLGHGVRVLERSHFPRFSIGESLLPQCMSHLETAGLLETVQSAGYQFKNGAAFTRGATRTAIDFREKFTEGWGTTFQIERADFDQRLIHAAATYGAQVAFGVAVTDFRPDAERPRVSYTDEEGRTTTLTARFVLDASGYGRVLARKLDLSRDPRLEPRMALFTHVEDRIDAPDYDREKILIGVHPEDPTIWYWLIPFANGHASVGVVGAIDTLERYGDNAEDRWRRLIDAEPRYRRLLHNARPVRPIGELKGYSADVSCLHGPGYALLGNAGEFLDPVFSSGVTIALRSAGLAAPLVDRQLRGEPVDWQSDFETPLRQGIATFRAFVDAWYDGRLQAIVFSEKQPDGLKRMISSVLAGYAWDERNPFVAATDKRLTTLAQLCGYTLPPARQGST